MDKGTRGFVKCKLPQLRSLDEGHSVLDNGKMELGLVLLADWTLTSAFGSFNGMRVRGQNTP